MSDWQRLYDEVVEVVTVKRQCKWVTKQRFKGGLLIDTWTWMRGQWRPYGGIWLYVNPGRPYPAHIALSVAPGTYMVRVRPDVGGEIVDD